MEKQNEANGTASEPIARYDELSVLRTYKVAFDTIVEMGGFWAVGNDKNLYRIEMPDKVEGCMWKNAKRYDIQTGKVMGYTNADRIRDMTDEELAEWITALTDCAVYPYTLKDAPCISIGQTCAASWLDWLKQEAQCTSG